MDKRSKASRDASQLSSGTIASLIHRSHYEIIDRAREDFAKFIDRMDEAAGMPLYPTWQEAWAAFRHTDRFYELALAGEPTDGKRGTLPVESGTPPAETE